MFVENRLDSTITQISNLNTTSTHITDFFMPAYGDLVWDEDGVNKIFYTQTSNCKYKQCHCIDHRTTIKCVHAHPIRNRKFCLFGISILHFAHFPSFAVVDLFISLYHIVHKLIPCISMLLTYIWFKEHQQESTLPVRTGQNTASIELKRKLYQHCCREAQFIPNTFSLFISRL